MNEKLREEIEDILDHAYHNGRLQKFNFSDFRDIAKELAEFIRPTESAERCKHGVWAADHCYSCEKESAERGKPWIKAEGNPPPPVGDARKLVWLRNADGFEWCGIRFYSGADGWLMDGRSIRESEMVLYWIDLPARPLPIPNGEEGGKEKPS